jgi:hypothetical protein
MRLGIALALQRITKAVCRALPGLWPKDLSIHDEWLDQHQALTHQWRVANGLGRFKFQ